MAEGVSIRVTHTGQSRSSIFIDDILEGQERTSLHRRPGPNYVPYLETVDYVYSGLVGISFESGSLRQFIDQGDLTAIFILSPLYLAALPPSGLHAPTHERAGGDPVDGDHLGIDFVPTNYTRDDTIPEADDVEDLAAHLKGLDNALSTVTGGPSVVQFNRDMRVPNAVPILFLSNGLVASSAAPLVFKGAGQLEGASISVDTPDAVRDYTLRVLVNGVIVENLVLLSGGDFAVTSVFTTAYASGDKLSAYLERTNGASAKSDFDQISVLVYFTET